MNDEQSRKVLEDFVAYLQDVWTLIEQKHIDAFLRDQNQVQEKILDWNQVADGVLVTSPGATQFIFKKNEFSEMRHFNGLMLDTENLNAWRGGDCPFGQPEAVRVEAQLRSGAVRRCQASNLCWGHERAEGDVLNYRVIGLSPGWKYPE